MVETIKRRSIGESQSQSVRVVRAPLSGVPDGYRMCPTVSEARCRRGGQKMAYVRNLCRLIRLARKERVERLSQSLIVANQP